MRAFLENIDKAINDHEKLEKESKCLVGALNHASALERLNALQEFALKILKKEPA